MLGELSLIYELFERVQTEDKSTSEALHEGSKGPTGKEAKVSQTKKPILQAMNSSSYITADCGYQYPIEQLHQHLPSIE